MLNSTKELLERFPTLQVISVFCLITSVFIAHIGGFLSQLPREFLSFVDVSVGLSLAFSLSLATVVAAVFSRVLLLIFEAALFTLLGKKPRPILRKATLIARRRYKIWRPSILLLIFFVIFLANYTGNLWFTLANSRLLTYFGLAITISVLFLAGSSNGPLWKDLRKTLRHSLPLARAQTESDEVVLRIFCAVLIVLWMSFVVGDVRFKSFLISQKLAFETTDGKEYYGLFQSNSGLVGYQSASKEMCHDEIIFEFVPNSMVRRAFENNEPSNVVLCE